MELTLYQQTMTFLWSFIAGVIIVLIYIMIEVIRELSPPNLVWLVMEDILFTGIAAAINLFFALSQTQGYIRWYVLLAQTTAFAVIYFTLGKMLKSLTKLLAGILKRGILAVCTPIYKISEKISRNVSEKCGFLLKKVKKIKK